MKICRKQQTFEAIE